MVLLSREKPVTKRFGQYAVENYHIKMLTIDTGKRLICSSIHKVELYRGMGNEISTANGHNANIRNPMKNYMDEANVLDDSLLPPVNNNNGPGGDFLQYLNELKKTSRP